MNTVMVTWRVTPSQKLDLIARQKAVHCDTLSEYMKQCCLPEFPPNYSKSAVYVDTAALRELTGAISELAEQFRRAGVLANQIAFHLNCGKRLDNQYKKLFYCVSEFLRCQGVLEEMRDRLFEMTKIPEVSHDC